ncbi:MAG: Aspartyl/glutamyl-tRNA(Asn/Gln) amidotransferase subunit C [Candidatus Nomurabacteria bacterium GW2011_GWB1_37_5]|uniref:Aspartyl/glutamyl-tRNA(Asn/Gln) amidotransferase subunit C n=1 Tax=Candidatus Nomurabacteria bacterium GW2011_GWB1_37_5 TaxID=1618742 RepID=A0A0G0JE60_9BACT|nr:MAG: Aspartyl/glutamyl-tRNA(Asn/Gln) amidotransferase subunit C [Candidatus Nomurabacteria bacterium GW2011_GWB1_37_5]
MEKLAELARIEINDEEKNELLGDLQAILGYVEQVNKASTVNQVNQAIEHVNIMREDKEPHETGIYTDKILAEVPESQDGYVKVKKIL